MIVRDLCQARSRVGDGDEATAVLARQIQK
jgi:hypothetical protein